MKAPIGSLKLNVSGSSSAMATAGPIPGRTPTNVPSVTPAAASSRFSGRSAVPKPSVKRVAHERVAAQQPRRERDEQHGGHDEAERLEQQHVGDEQGREQTGRRPVRGRGLLRGHAPELLVGRERRPREEGERKDDQPDRDDERHEARSADGDAAAPLGDREGGDERRDTHCEHDRPEDARPGERAARPRSPGAGHVHLPTPRSAITPLTRSVSESRNAA
jgi:hypothetical protein